MDIVKFHAEAVSTLGKRPLAVTLADANSQACAIKASSLLVQAPRMVDGGFQNLTDIIVPTDVSTLLSFGIKFVPPVFPSFAEYIKTLYDVQHLGIRLHKDPSVYLRGYLTKSYDRLLTTLQEKPTSYDLRLSLMVEKTKQFLTTHVDACLIQSDKAKSVVLVMKSDYDSKMEDLISKNIKKGIYAEITCPRVVSLIKEDWIKRYTVLSQKLGKEWTGAKNSKSPLPFPMGLKRMLTKFSGSHLQLPYLYGSLKTHKDGVPCRPICSTRMWCSYPLQKIICYVLTQATSSLSSIHNVKNIDEIAHQLLGFTVFRDFEFVKVDVDDMYPSMDRVEILNLIQHFVTSDVYLKGNYLSGELLMECLKLCLGDDTLFTYKDRTFRQLRGLPQGACDSGLLATLLLDHLLQMYADEIFVRNTVVWWRKYVDDFCFYMHKDGKSRLVEALTAHTHLNFTMETEEVSPYNYVDGQVVYGTLTFLDLEIFRCARNVFVRTYTKPMVSERMCHYLTRCPVRWKENTVVYYIRRVLLRVSNPFLIPELYNLERKFMCNMYPRVLYSNCIIRVVNSHVKSCRQSLHSTQHGSRTNLCNLGDLTFRCFLLKTYIDNLGPLPSIYFKDLQVNLNVILGGQAKLRTYNPSVPFICEEFTAVLRRIYHELDGGILTHCNGPTLFSLLGMQMNRYGVDSVPPSILHTWVIRCPNCTYTYLACGASDLVGILSQVMCRPDNPISVHMRTFQHEEPNALVSNPLGLDRHTSIPTKDRVTLMKAVFDSLGYDCASVSKLSLIPLFVRQGLDRYLASPRIN